MRAAIVGLLVLLAASVAWLAGEQHRRNCISSGRVECSVLPWKAGSRPSEALDATSEPKQPTLTEYGCEQLLLENAYALTEEDRKPTPPECQ